MTAAPTLREAADMLDAVPAEQAAAVLSAALCAAGACVPEPVLALILRVARPVLRTALVLLADVLDGKPIEQMAIPDLDRAPYTDVAGAIAAETERLAKRGDTDPAPPPHSG